MKIHYGFYESPFGMCVVGFTEKGICHLSFSDTPKVLQQEFPKAQLEPSPYPIDQSFIEQTPLDLHGTPFQQSIWAALCQIPKGETITYEDVARRAGKPKAIRAAASAVARNKISLRVPCHRVVPKSGGVGNYRWGSARKQRILNYEQGKQSA